MANKTIKPKRTTLSTLQESEKILEEGEVLFVYPDTGPGTGPICIVCGDGKTSAKDLPVAIDGNMIETLETWKSEQDEKMSNAESVIESHTRRLASVEKTQQTQSNDISTLSKKR